MRQHQDCACTAQATAPGSHKVSSVRRQPTPTYTHLEAGGAGAGPLLLLLAKLELMLLLLLLLLVAVAVVVGPGAEVVVLPKAPGGARALEWADMTALDTALRSRDCLLCPLAMTLSAWGGSRDAVCNTST